MIGLALEGGGVKGSYQAGVYLAFLECGVSIDGVCGTSIGALNASIIASGAGAKLPAIWRNTNVGKTFGFSEEFVDSINDHKFNLKASIQNIINIISNRGIDLKGVKEILDTYLDIDKLYDSPMDFGLVTVRARDMKPLYLFKEDIPKEKVKEYILASCYLPIFRMEKIIDDNYYLDGGFYDNGPVNMLLKKGYKTVYLIKVQGIGFSQKYDNNADVRIIESKRKLGKILDFDSNRVAENIKMGYYDALRVLKNYDGSIYVFKRKSEKFYEYLNRNVDERLFRRVKNFFGTNSFKDTTIAALEYIMEKEEIYYYEVYDTKRILRVLKKKSKKEHFIYEYIKSLKYRF